MTTTHPELEAEQRYLDRAYDLLERKLADAEYNLAKYQPVDRNAARALRRVKEILGVDKHGDGPLIFGRMDDDEGPLYIGRRRIFDEDYEPVVISWHAPVAAKFYEASADDPKGLLLKRTFVEEDRRITKLIDEIVKASPHDVSPGSDALPMVSDALLAELERYRDGAMRDVVATIQAEQYGIMREPGEGVLVVQGGPGTGKTVVGLHRAAWLAFNREDVRAAGMLVVAPNVPFLNYMAGVLPSLNAADIFQTDIDSLYAGDATSRGTENDAEVSQVKGSAEMAEVLRRTLDARRGWTEEDLVLNVGATRFTVAASQIRELVDDLRSRTAAHNDLRDVLRTRFAELCFAAYRTFQQEHRRPVVATMTSIQRLNGFVTALDRMWPSFTPESLLRTLFGTQDLLLRATDGVLSPDDRARLYRPPATSITDEPWTEDDLFLLDDLAELLNGRGRTYGHIVVDEAQDLSPMQARALARRCPSASVTLLGDLAQATGAWIRDDWSELTRFFAPEAREATLSIGYRVPRSVIELAGRQLPLVSPGLTAPDSIREGLGDPVVRKVPRDELVREAVYTAEAAAANGLKVALIVPDARYDAVLRFCDDVGAKVGDGRTGDFSLPISVLPAALAKGLEFNAVVLMAPDEIVSGSWQGRRALYVAMTRCTQSLAILHADRLPAGLDHLDVEPFRSAFEDASGEGNDLVDASSDTSDDLHALIDRLGDSEQALIEALVRRLLGT